MILISSVYRRWPVQYICMTRKMDTNSVRENLEKGTENASLIDGLPLKFFQRFIMADIHVDLIEPGRVICSMKVPPRLVNASNFLHAGVIGTLVDLVGAAAICTGTGVVKTGVSTDVNFSYMGAAYVGEEIEIKAKSLHVGKVIAIASVEIRKKETGEIIVQGRHTVYLVISSKI